LPSHGLAWRHGDRVGKFLPADRAREDHAHKKFREHARIAAQRTDRYVASSGTTQERIRAYFGRDANIVYPPVETARFTPGSRTALINDGAVTMRGGTFLVNGDDPNLVVFPTHRLVHSLPRFDLDELLGKAQPMFSVLRREDKPSADVLLTWLAKEAPAHPAFVVVEPDVPAVRYRMLETFREYAREATPESPPQTASIDASRGNAPRSRTPEKCQ